MENKSILIKDTTPEERRKIVEEALNAWSDSSCDMDDSPINYDDYINGKKELRQLNDEYRANYIQAALLNRDESTQNKSSCSM